MNFNRCHFFLMLFSTTMNNNKNIIILKLINLLINCLNLLVKLQDMKLKAFIFQMKFNETLMQLIIKLHFINQLMNKR
jgi:hypothetical protein